MIGFEIERCKSYKWYQKKEHRIGHVTSNILHNLQTIIMIIIFSAKMHFRVCWEWYSICIILMKIPRRWSIIDFCNYILLSNKIRLRGKNLLKMMGYINGRTDGVKYCNAFSFPYNNRKKFLLLTNIHVHRIKHMWLNARRLNENGR